MNYEIGISNQNRRSFIIVRSSIYVMAEHSISKKFASLLSISRSKYCRKFSTQLTTTITFIKYYISDASSLYNMLDSVPIRTLDC